MTLDELEAELPNGLHDALLRAYSSDLAVQRAEFTLDVWVGDLRSDIVSERERYRPARLELLGLTYLVVDDPGPGAVAGVGALDATVRIDTCAADDDAERAGLVPRGGFAGRFFVNEWNAFIHFGALETRLTWLGVN
jgi:hypothetical protein